MVQRLRLTMEIRQDADGTIEARCPELSVSARGRHLDEAIDNLRETVFSSLGGGFDISFNNRDNPERIDSILSRNPQCYFHIPRNPQVH